MEDVSYDSFSKWQSLSGKRTSRITPDSGEDYAGYLARSIIHRLLNKLSLHDYTKIKKRCKKLKSPALVKHLVMGKTPGLDVNLLEDIFELITNNELIEAVFYLYTIKKFDSDSMW